MDENRISKNVLWIMGSLNYLIILFISLMMAYCLEGYIQENSALIFLTRIPRMPVTAWKIPVLTSCLFGSCLFLMQIQNASSYGLVFKVCMEIVLCYFISFILGFSYTGMILLVLADTMKYFPKTRWKIVFAFFICICYLLADYDLLSARYEMISLESYVEYFQSDVRSSILGIRNMLASLNMIVFIIYMILQVRIQMSENDRILSLNEQLNEANEELRQANIQLEEYARESEKMVQTRERNRLAREIHDTLGHALTGIITGIEACTALMDAAPEAAKAQLALIAEVARKGMTDVRRSVKALRPDALEKFNLENALLQMIDETRSVTNATIDYQCTTGLNCFNDDEEEIIYRIVQECMTNSIRHGKAKKISIRIDREFHMLKIVVQDNGMGCTDIQKGFGLHHMEERLNLLQGKLSFSGEDGFLVEAQIPVRWGTEEKEHD